MSHTLKEIFESNYSPLCNYAQSIVKDYHLAKDLVQSVFIQLWEKDILSTIENPEPYLIKCIKYKCIDYLRTPSRKKEIFKASLPDTRQEELQSIQEEDILPMLHFFAGKLPSKMRQVFLLSRQSGMTYKEIAVELDISIKTVENQMGNALKKLRIILRKHHYLPVLALFI